MTGYDKMNSFLLAIIALAEKDCSTDYGHAIKVLALDVANMLYDAENEPCECKRKGKEAAVPTPESRGEKEPEEQPEARPETPPDLERLEYPLSARTVARLRGTEPSAVYRYKKRYGIAECTKEAVKEYLTAPRKASRPV